MDCPKGYENVGDIVRLDSKLVLTKLSNPTFKIDNDSDYFKTFDSNFPFGKIDFIKYTLLGLQEVCVGHGYEISSQCYLCRDKVNKVLNFTGEFSLREQCAGGVTCFSVSFWILSPKILADERVQFVLINDNPY